MDTQKAQRRYDLDWLNVLAICAVFLYHTTRFFDSGDWHIKNIQTSQAVDIFKSIFDLWGMPLMFMLSGASVYFALRPGGAARFLRDRVVRLLVPLGFGIVFFGPLQIYLERVSHGEFQGSLLEFVPLYFKDWRIYQGNFAWSGVHLWYLENLFLFTLALLPLFVALKSTAGQRMIEHLSQLSARPGAIYLWALPLALLLILFDPLGVLGEGLSEDLTRLVVFPPIFLYGFLFISSRPVQQAVIRQRRFALALAFVLTLAFPALASWVEEDPSSGLFAAAMIFLSFLTWTYLLAILGFGMHYLTANHRLLPHAREAVLPFYILHQPVILVLGSSIIPLPLPIFAKWLLIAPAALAITLGLYWLAVRPYNPVRWLFGLKPLKPVSPAVELAAA